MTHRNAHMDNQSTLTRENMSSVGGVVCDRGHNGGMPLYMVAADSASAHAYQHTRATVRYINNGLRILSDTVRLLSEHVT